ncbi:MAG TPA: class I SAM-dependent methyltransferase [Chloroflexota bacterium]|nr:class I SAM-dependent methyltransferase [Chloroflexota bacterium]
MTSAQPSRYPGGELELFAAAAHWKSYIAAQIRPYLGPEVLEVGAGIGATTRLLCTPEQTNWLALEPDPSLASEAVAAFTREPLAAPWKVVAGTLESIDAGMRFSSVLYVDVLEHINDDRAELRRAAERLRPGGYLVVLAPAHQWLYSPFDRAIGHCRRYSASILRKAAPPELTPVRMRYLDAVGLLASSGNRFLVRQAMPTRTHIAAWDRVMVPLSRLVDPLLGFTVGKSVLAIWRR